MSPRERARKKKANGLNSRRKTQCRAKRYKNKVAANLDIPIKQSIYHITQRCLHNHCFWTNPNSSIQKNFNDILVKEIQPIPPQPSNLTFHNLYKTIKLPADTRQILSLNLKYYLVASKPPDNLKKTVQKMAHSICTKFQMDMLDQSTENNYIKQLYIRNKNWNPSPAPLHIEDKITRFDKLCKDAQQKLASKNHNKILRI